MRIRPHWAWRWVAPAARRLAESATFPRSTLDLTYDTVGVPTYGNLTVQV